MHVQESEGQITQRRNIKPGLNWNGLIIKQLLPSRVVEIQKGIIIAQVAITIAEGEEWVHDLTQQLAPFYKGPVNIHVGVAGIIRTTVSDYLSLCGSYAELHPVQVWIKGKIE